MFLAILHLVAYHDHQVVHREHFAPFLFGVPTRRPCDLPWVRSSGTLSSRIPSQLEIIVLYLDSFLSLLRIVRFEHPLSWCLDQISEFVRDHVLLRSSAVRWWTSPFPVSWTPRDVSRETLGRWTRLRISSSLVVLPLCARGQSNLHRIPWTEVVVLNGLWVSPPSSDLGGRHVVSCTVGNRKYDGRPRSFRRLSRNLCA